MGHLTELAGETLVTLIALVRKHTGIAMTERKSVLLQGRLRPRMRQLALENYRDYLALVERGGAEVPFFIDLVTTNDTLFFRTPQVWEYFASEFLPTWIATHPGQTLRIWSAAAASGEEAYSLAMLCHEFQRGMPEFEYQILGTDISRRMLELGRAGEYNGRSLERIKASQPRLFERYFVDAGAAAKVRPELKRHVSFAEHNLLQALAPEQQFDIVFLRNVLFYFDVENQEAILRQVHRNMKREAMLIIGESESLSRLNTAYRFEMPLIYSRDEVIICTQ